MTRKTTHFGYQEVAVNEKARRVRSVFDAVASRYDLMNDLMSLGLHRQWKRYTVDAIRVRNGERVLDLAAGTGDLARLFHERVGVDGEVVVADINANMLALGRERLLDRGVVRSVRYVQADAELLPFADASFDCVCIGFGLRNVTHKDKALRAMQRVLRPGGRAAILEFSKPRLASLRPIYDAYSFQVLPRLGKLVANDEASYRYLAESIRKHPDQEELLAMLDHAGFEMCTVDNLLGGVVALHRGYKL